MTTNARSKATRCLANAFKELRKAQCVDVLEFWHAFLDGFVQGLEAVGRVTKEQAQKLIGQRDKIYDERREFVIKEELRQRYNQRRVPSEFR